MVRQLDTQLKVRREETLHSINCPIIKTGMPRWQLESHLLSICAPETPHLLFQKSRSNCHWHNLWLLKCDGLLEFPQDTSHAGADNGWPGLWQCCVKPDKPFSFLHGGLIRGAERANGWLNLLAYVRF